MSLQGFGGATKFFSIDKRFTALELISTRDCIGPERLRPALLVRGGGRIEKTLCANDLVISGDTVLEGNLIVLGEKVTQQVQTVVIEDRNICLGNVDGAPATDESANAGGIIVKGPQPGGSKSWLWYQDIGPGGAWRANQDIDIGPGRLEQDGVLPGCPGCGSDTNQGGTAYRIGGEPVLTLTELGNTVICSHLEKVATLRKGAIDNASQIVSTITGSPTCINTAEAHCLLTGDQVLITGSDTTPLIDGCHTVTVTSSTQFKIPVNTMGASGTMGEVNGPNFPINVGTSAILSGTHEVQCGNDLIVRNGMQATRFLMDGTTEQLCVTGTVSQDYTAKVLTSFMTPFSGIQRGTLIDNKSASANITSTSIAQDISQCYDGTNTAFTNIESTVKSVGQRVRMKVNPKAPLPKLSSRGIDIESKSGSNRGSNIGLYAEAGGPAGSSHTAGVIGFTNATSGMLSTGGMFCANQSRTGIATEILAAGSQTVGLYACNPNMGPTDWAICANGRVKLNGNTYVIGNAIISGDLCLEGNLKANIDFVSDPLCVHTIIVDRIEGKTDQSIEITANLNPDSPGITLGNAANQWAEGWFGNVTSDLVCVNDGLLVNDIYGKHQGNVTLNATLNPGGDSMYTIGTQNMKWFSGYFDNLVVCDNLLVKGNTTYIGSNIFLIQDNLLVLNVPPQTADCDAGFMTQRYQIDSDTCEGDVVSDTPVESDAIVAATAVTITLAATAHANMDFYKDWWVKIADGVGAMQVRQIVSYDGATKIATLSSAWTTVPVASDTYELFACNYTGSYWDESMKKWVFACISNASVKWVRDEQRFFSDICLAELTATTVITSNVQANVVTAPLGCFDDLQTERIIAKIDDLTLDVGGMLSALTPETNFTGNVDIDGALNVDGATTMGGHLQVNADANITGKLTAGELCVNGDSTLNGNLLVGGDTTLIDLTADNIDANTLVVQGDTCIFGNLQVDLIEPKEADAVFFNGNVRPTEDCFDLGSPSKQWGNIYAKGLHIQGPGIQLGCLLYSSDEMTITHAGGGAWHDLSTYLTVIGKVYYLEYRVTGIKDTGQTAFCSVVRAAFLNRGDGIGGGEIIRMNFTDITDGYTGIGGPQYDARIVPTTSGGAISGNTITFQVTTGNRVDTVTWRSCISLYLNPEGTPVI
jgi:cytoskeletal protein CcmA (bactofilin family)